MSHATRTLEALRRADEEGIDTTDGERRALAQALREQATAFADIADATQSPILSGPVDEMQAACTAYARILEESSPDDSDDDIMADVAGWRGQL